MQQQSFGGLLRAAGVIAALALIGAGCAKTAPVTPNTTTNTTTTVNASNANSDADAGTSLQVPAPGFENVNETVVNTDGEEEEVEDVVEDVDEASNTNVAPQPSTKTFSIKARQWEFEPNTVTVNKGDKVVLNVTSEDVSHGFFLDDFGVNETLKPGTTSKIEFTADQAGTFSFACSVFCGSGHGGMTGTLVVK